MTLTRDAIGTPGGPPLATASTAKATRRPGWMPGSRSSAADDVFVSYRRRYRRRLVVAGALSVVQAGLVVLQPWPLKLAVDHAASGTPLPGWTGPIGDLAPSTLAAVTALSSVVLVLISGLIGYGETMLVGRVAEQLAADLRHGVMARLMALSGRFHDRHRSGDLVSRVTGDVGRVQDALVASYTVLVPESLTLFGMVLVLLSLDLTLGFIALGAVPVLVAVIVKRRRLVREAQRRARDESGRLASTATDIVRNVRVIQAFQRQSDSLERFTDRNLAVMDTSVSSMRIDARFSPLGNLVLSVGSASVLWIGVLRVQQGRMSVGTLLIVLSYVGSVYGPVRSLSSLATSLARGAASKDRLREVIDSTDELPFPASPVTIGAVQRGLVFDDVSFEYEPGVPVIRGASFAVAAGEHFCIVGPTGAGKSTVLQLLLRLYDPTGGRISLDGIDLRAIEMASLRERFGLVSQQPWMLDGSIAENIAFGRADATRAEIEIIGRFALIDEFVDRFPLGYDTPVGEGGARLSGGQLRRIGFARAIVRLPDILLLDEPTSGLDAHSELQIVRAINRVRRGRTVITVTHHLGLAETADRVAVLEGGRIVEVGTPGALRSQGGAYARLLQAADRADVFARAPGEPAAR